MYVLCFENHILLDDQITIDYHFNKNIRYFLSKILPIQIPYQLKIGINTLNNPNQFNKKQLENITLFEDKQDALGALRVFKANIKQTLYKNAPDILSSDAKLEHIQFLSDNVSIQEIQHI